MTTTRRAHVPENIPYAIRPILSILNGYTPGPKEDLEYLIGQALKDESAGNNGDKDLDTPAFQVDRQKGVVRLFRYSAWAEDNYAEEQFERYPDDPLDYLHYEAHADVRTYTRVQVGGNTVSYLMKKG